MTDITYYPLSPRQLQLTELMKKQGGPEELIQVVIRNLMFLSRSLAQVDTDELIRAVWEAEKISKTDKDYTAVAKTINLWLVHKKNCINMAQQNAKNKEDNVKKLIVLPPSDNHQ